MKPSPVRSVACIGPRMEEPSPLQFLSALALFGGATAWFLHRLIRVVSLIGTVVPIADPPVRLPVSAMACVSLWMAVLISGKLTAKAPAAEHVTLFAVQLSCLISLAITVLVPWLLSELGRQELSPFGITFRNGSAQLQLGVSGFLAAAGPTALLLVLSTSWRTEETQHAYLQALQGEQGRELLMWIALSAAIAAPLAEEMLFRVTLQGWLSERLPGSAAVGLTAVMFALVHGWRDALPLIPLSLILGYLFHRTRSYWGCVLTHALFNGANLALATLAMEQARK